MFDLQTTQKFAQFLRIYKFITLINLRQRVIGAKGAVALAETVIVNNYLTLNYLWRNGIGDTGAKVLAAALRFNTSIR